MADKFYEPEVMSLHISSIVVQVFFLSYTGFYHSQYLDGKVNFTMSRCCIKKERDVCLNLVLPNDI